jgi:hypothetical protein
VSTKHGHEALTIDEKQTEALRRAAADPHAAMQWIMRKALSDGGLLVRGDRGFELTDAGKIALVAVLPEGTSPDAVRPPTGRVFRVVGTAEVLTLIARATGNAHAIDGELRKESATRPATIDADAQAMLDLLAHRDALAAAIAAKDTEIARIAALCGVQAHKVDAIQGEISEACSRGYLGGIVANVVDRLHAIAVALNER